VAEELGYDVEDSETIPDGGEPVADGGSLTKYYWSSQGGILYHTETAVSLLSVVSARPDERAFR